ncbi:hypothetical protein C5B90_19075 [Haloferax sp. Atlit-12N]|uniref:hypothetical protein n=1 Tax=Haloferax sp. Atlit-12N TaxID=2077203 RepID=UPI000E23E5CE|nr:hypothetical protein [Haloferax sp. Atlit-12N]RDZ61377.1 hypothetical protein C5B90_19075 [Haloferax sp. Atlit-12N]
MTDIEIRNENGQLVGYDRDTGDKVPISFESVSADELHGVADTIVSTTSDLQTIFNNLSAGETVYVARPDTPYRTDQWLDIEVDDVTVVFQSPYAKDGSAIVKVADEGNVGGIRVGWNSSVERVEVVNFGHHGNPNGQTNPDNSMDSIIVHQATDVEIRGGFLTRQAPYHVHNDGGSGITTTASAKHVEIHRVLLDDVGDRGIQTGGVDIDVHHNTLLNGYDRSLNGGGRTYTDLESHGERIRFAYNYCANNSDGSIIGLGNQNDGPTDVDVIGNIGYGEHRKFIRVQPATSKVRVAYNRAIRGTGTNDNPAYQVRGPSDVTLEGNYARGYNTAGYTVTDAAGTPEDVTFRDNTAEDCNMGLSINGTGTNIRWIDGDLRNIWKTAVDIDPAFSGSLEVRGTTIKNYDTNAGGNVAINVPATGVRFIDNHIVYNGSSALCFEGSGGGNTWKGNSATGGSWNINGTDTVTIDNQPVVKRNLANITGGKNGAKAFHNGGDGSPVGYYWLDLDGDVSAGDWIRVGDNTTTITPA